METWGNDAVLFWSINSELLEFYLNSLSKFSIFPSLINLFLKCFSHNTEDAVAFQSFLLTNLVHF